MDKNVMNKLSYGIFVCTAKEGEKDNGCIINTVTQLTTTPNVVSIAVNKANYTHDMIVRTREFNVSVINEDGEFEMIKQFGFQSGKDVDKFSPESGHWMEENKSECKRAANGIMYITKGVNSYISCKVKESMDLGTHTLFICEVTYGEILNDVPSATYAYYHQHIKTQVEQVGTTADGKAVWKCKICGYVYEGDPIPDDFICPWCKHPSDDFERVLQL